MTQKPFSHESITAAYKEINDDRIAREAATILALIDEYGDDDNPHGTVLRFTKTFTGNSKVYTYAAIKTIDADSVRKPEFWTMTGGANTQYTWDDLVMWLVTDGLPVQAEDVEVVYPEGYEPPAKHVHGPECYGIPVDALAQLFGNKPVTAPADAETGEELSTSDIVLTSTGEQAADEEPEYSEDELIDSPDAEDEINGDRTPRD